MQESRQGPRKIGPLDRWEMLVLHKGKLLALLIKQGPIWNSFWNLNQNLMKIIFALILILKVQYGHKFVHVPTAHKQNYDPIGSLLFNSLWRSDTIWQCRVGSTLAQEMACCLTTPSHCMKGCWFIISSDVRHSLEGIFTRSDQDINP